MIECLELIGHDPNRQGHERNAVHAAATVLAKKITRAAVFLGVLVRDQLVEKVDDLVSRRLQVLHGYVVDEVVSTNVPHEPAWS